MSMKVYPEYKDSGVEWLGNVPAHWEINRIGRVSKSGMGQTILKEMLADQADENTLPVYSASESEEEFGHFRSPSVRLVPGDLIIGARGSIGHTRRVVSPCTCSQTTIWVNTDQEAILPDYLYWSMLGGRSELFPFDKTAIPMLTVNQVRRGAIAIPPPIEQAAIAAFLDRETGKIDALVEEQRRLIALLKEKRQAVISQAVTKGLNPDVSMKPSGIEWLGDIPAHWEIRRAKDVADIFVPQRTKPETNETDGLFWVTMEVMQAPKIQSSNLRVSKAAANIAGCRPLSAGAVIASCIGTFGIASVNQVDVYINQQLQAYIPGRLVLSQFLVNCVELSVAFFDKYSTAATLRYVNQASFGLLPIPLPPLQEQRAITAFIESETQKFYKMIDEAKKATILLQERRAALISATVTGKIDVRSLVDASMAMEAV